MTKIEWCDMTWNPVWGCKNQCPYCYARKMAKRFAGKIAEKEFNFLYPDARDTVWHSPFCTMLDYIALEIEAFNPFWIESNFQKSFPKKPSRIFVNSMSDIAFWKPEWMEKVLNKIKEYPQHTFLFLTKKICKLFNWKFPKNCWIGVTAINENEISTFSDDLFMFPDNIRFISIEPIQEKISKRFLNIDNINWLIIGAETGNRKNKIIPKKEWIEEFIRPDITIPIFMKNNLKPYWNGKFRQEFPD